jgi:hypothetical protein
MALAAIPIQLPLTAPRGPRIVRGMIVLRLAVALLAAVLPTAALAQPVIGRCPVFPANNIWNTPVDTLPVDPRSGDYIASIGAAIGIKADFGSGLYENARIGVPFVGVTSDQPMVPIHFAGFGDEPEPYVDESDPGPYPIPPGAPIEGGPDAVRDRHVVVVQQGSCMLFELYKGVPNGDGSWNAVASARFDLESNDLRIDGWTSADAAGLPIFPGLARYDEVAAGRISHALRFTVPETRRDHLWPARHHASDSDDPALPPMGQRFRLKASVEISGFSPANQVILRALQTYGMILADNGSPWFISGAPHDLWDNDDLRELGRITGADFEAVDVTSLMNDPNSGEAKSP